MSSTRDNRRTPIKRALQELVANPRDVRNK
jgi:hypothetical protein